MRSELPPTVGGYVSMGVFAADIEGKNHYTQMCPARILEVTDKDILVVNLGHNWTTYDGEVKNQTAVDKKARKAFESKRCGGIPNGLKFRLPITENLYVLDSAESGFWIWEDGKEAYIGKPHYSGWSYISKAEGAALVPPIVCEDTPIINGPLAQAETFDYGNEVEINLPKLRPENITGYEVCWYFNVHGHKDQWGETTDPHHVFECVCDTEAEALKEAKRRGKDNGARLLPIWDGGYDVRPYFGDRTNKQFYVERDAPKVG